MLHATLPYPPTVNHCWNYGKGRVYMTAEARAYRRQIQKILQDAPKEWDERPGVIADNIRLWVVLHPPDNRRRDTDNILKCLLDALVHAGMMVDDSQIVELSVVRGPVISPRGMVKIELDVVESEAANAAGGDDGRD